MEDIIVDNAKVLPEGKITLPKDVRNFLRIDTGDRVTMVCKDDQVILMNSAAYALRMLQKDMSGAAKAAGINSNEDIMNFVKDVREKIEGL